jgi:hypothetical protein
MYDKVLIQEFEGGTTYITEADDLETAKRYMQYAMMGQPGSICLTNSDKSLSMVVYCGPDFENQEISEDLTKAMVNALGLSMDDLRAWISSNKTEGGVSC